VVTPLAQGKRGHLERRKKGGICQDHGGGEKRSVGKMGGQTVVCWEKKKWKGMTNARSEQKKGAGKT